MRVLPQVLVEDDLMDESNVALPVVLRLWRRERNVKREVMVRVCETLEILFVKNLLS
jgi:hypothetical protein